MAVVWDTSGDGNYSRSYIGQVTAYDESSGKYTVHRSINNTDAYIIISGGIYELPRVGGTASFY